MKVFCSGKHLTKHHRIDQVKVIFLFPLHTSFILGGKKKMFIILEKEVVGQKNLESLVFLPRNLKKRYCKIK